MDYGEYKMRQELSDEYREVDPYIEAMTEGWYVREVTYSGEHRMSTRVIGPVPQTHLRLLHEDLKRVFYQQVDSIRKYMAAYTFPTDFEQIDKFTPEMWQRLCDALDRSENQT